MVNFSKPSGPLLIFIIVIVLLIIIQLVTYGPLIITTCGVNSTVGMAFDTCSLVNSVAVIVLLLCTIGYTILAFFKTRINKTVSVFHTSSLFLIFILLAAFSHNDIFCILQLILSFILLLLFIVNAIFAVHYKLVDKKRNN